MSYPLKIFYNLRWSEYLTFGNGHWLANTDWQIIADQRDGWVCRLGGFLPPSNVLLLAWVWVPLRQLLLCGPRSCPSSAGSSCRAGCHVHSTDADAAALMISWICYLLLIISSVQLCWKTKHKQFLGQGNVGSCVGGGSDDQFNLSSAEEQNKQIQY